MKSKTIRVTLDSNPKGLKRPFGGSRYDAWNDRLSALVAHALTSAQQKDADSAASAVLSGILDINPADPIEGMLAAQMIAAHETALVSYRKAWQQPSEYFVARTKYLALADKASRTVAVLAERLDQHRGRGHQQIVVKHVTVNADQAVVADQVMTDTRSIVGRPAGEPNVAAFETGQDREQLPVLPGGAPDAK